MFSIRDLVPRECLQIPDYMSKSRNLFMRFVDDSPFCVVDDKMIVDETAYFISNRENIYSLTSNHTKFKRCYARGMNIIYLPLFVPLNRNNVIESKRSFCLGYTDFNYFPNSICTKSEYPDFVREMHYMDSVGRSHSLITVFLTAAIRCNNLYLYCLDQSIEEYKHMLDVAENVIGLEDIKTYVSDEGFDVVQFRTKKAPQKLKDFNHYLCLKQYLNRYEEVSEAFMCKETNAEALKYLLYEVV